MTASIFSPHYVVTTNAETPLPTQRRSVPTASALFPIINEPWVSSASFAGAADTPASDGAPENWGLRQDLMDMAAAQRGHVLPRNSSPVGDRTDSDDRIANALFGSRRIPLPQSMVDEAPGQSNTARVGLETGLRWIVVSAMADDQLPAPYVPPEKWDIRSDLIEMAGAQRGHWEKLCPCPKYAVEDAVGGSK